jgi:purine catabolism regulator
VSKLTLGELLELNVLGDAKVLSAREQILSKQIEWVSVIEIPVEDFVRRDELVLTTGLGAGDPEALKRFVEEIRVAGAAAVGIALGPHVQDVPEDVVALAESWNFPLLTIPWGVRFADISRRFYSEMALRTASLEYSDGIIRPALLRLAQGDRVDAVVDILGRGLRVEMAFFDALTGLWTGSQPFGEWCRENRDELESLLVVPPDVACLPYQTKRAMVDGSEVQVLPVVSAGRWLGTLVVRPEDTKSESVLLEPYERIVTHLLALMCLHQELLAVGDVHRQEDFVWKLAQGEFRTWDELLAAAAGFEFDVIQYYACAVGRLDNWERLYRYNQTVFHEMTRQTWENDVVQKVQYILAKSAEMHEYRVMSTYHRGDWIVYFFSPKRILPSAVIEVLQGVQKALAVHVAHGSLSWGVAAGGPGVQGFHGSYQNAHTSLELGIRRQGVGQCYEYEQVSNNQMLVRFAVDASVRNVVQATLGGLVEYDRQHESELVHTLWVYLQNRTNVTVTARALHLHRQSLLYRLSKIEFLTGRLLSNSEDLFLLEFCLRVMNVESHPGFMGQ